MGCHLLNAFLLLLSAWAAHAQSVDLGKIPAFSMYGDNYFVTGTSASEFAAPETSDIKFQIGFKHRLLNTKMPLGSTIFITYQQRSFWDIYRESAPFRETNYNPGLALGRAINRKNELYGVVYLEVEHQSNGRDGTASRSWNRVSLNTKWCLTDDLRVDVSAWLPFGVAQNANPDLLDFVGYQGLGFSWRFSPRFFLDVDSQAAFADDVRGSVTAGLYFQHTSSDDRYLYFQVFHGYAEELFNYNIIRSYARLGIAFRHAFFNID